MPVFDTSIRTKLVDGSTDLGGKGWVLKDYIIEVYPNLVPDVKTPALWGLSGPLWGWGANGYYQSYEPGHSQVGGSINHISSPIQTIASGVWKTAAASFGNTFAIKSGGTLWGSGWMGNGALGNNETLRNPYNYVGAQYDRSSPVQTVTGGNNWSKVASGYKMGAGIKTDGTLWVWGLNDFGQLGDNTVISKSSPVQTVTGGTNWSSISISAKGRSPAGIKTDGTLWTWGRNNFGQLGDNTIASRSSPVQTIAGGTTWKQVSCGGFHTAAIKTDGSLWIWGLGTSGQLGDNTIVSKSSPVQTIAGGTNWKQVSCGYYHTAAIKTDGTLWLCGINSVGQLGDNTVISKSSPVQTVIGGSTWKQASSGHSHSVAIKTDGTLWLWGSNYYGQLGDNTAVNKSSPIQTLMYTKIWRIAFCGYGHTIAIQDAG